MVGNVPNEQKASGFRLLDSVTLFLNYNINAIQLREILLFHTKY
jgi:hypothetical protein